MTLEKDAFLDLILANRKIIYKICHAYCRDPEDRKDLEQEIIVQLWHSADKYDDQYKISTWIYRIALNVAISFLRREKSRKNRLSAVDQHIIERVADDREPEELTANIQLLYHFIDQLDELNRALMLLYLEDHSHKDIAEILGISETNVATKISRIKQRLREDFRAETTDTVS